MATRRTRIVALAVVALAATGALWLALDATPDTALRGPAEKLKSLPYLSWARAEGGDGEAGVLLHDAARTAPGIHLYASEVASGAQFMDLEGNVVGRLHDRRDEPTIWKLVKPLADDTYGVLAAGGTVLRLDRRSRILFQHTDTFHHDFDFTPDGLLVAPAWRTRRFPEIGWLKPVKDDVLTAVDASGAVRWEISMADAILAEPDLVAAARERPDRLLDWRKNTLHTNTVTVLPRRVEYEGGLVFPAGAVLTCWRNLDTVAVLDVRPGVEKRVLWHWGLGELDLPHHPTLLDDGRLLVFDNGTRRGWSRVLEVDPATDRIEWEYRAAPDPEAFFSSSRGASQRLPNGNTLIVESQRGRVFEVTRDGEIVWDFLEPRTRVRGITRTPERATIYRMRRLPIDPFQRLTPAPTTP